MINDKKKKQGLASMAEKMGLNEGSDYVTPASKGLIPPAAGGVDETNNRSVGSKLRNRMTGKS